MESAPESVSNQPLQAPTSADNIDNLTLPPKHETVATHSLALTLLATLALVFALNWAQSFEISLLLGILFAYTLNP